MGISTFAAPANLAEASDMAGDVWTEGFILKQASANPNLLKAPAARIRMTLQRRLAHGSGSPEKIRQVSSAALRSLPSDVSLCCILGGIALQHGKLQVCRPSAAVLILSEATPDLLSRQTLWGRGMCNFAPAKISSRSPQDRPGVLCGLGLRPSRSG